MEWVFTGFEPFGDHLYNPSWDVAQGAAEALSGTAYELEVTFEAARRYAGWLLPEGSGTGDEARRLVMFGLAGRASEIRFERFAHNLRGVEDFGEEPLEPGVAMLRATALDVSALARRWKTRREADMPMPAVSRDTGNYVCNALYWHTLGRVGTALFVHVPPMEPALARRVGARLAEVLASP